MFSSDAELQKSLDEFAADPRGASSKNPIKRDENGALIERPRTAFDASDLADGHFALHRDSLRKTFHTVIDGVMVSLEGCTPGKAPIEAIDRPENLVDQLAYRTLTEMETNGLRKASLAITPWSDDYWALYLGCLGKRYSDPDFPGSEDWEENYEYVRENPVQQVLASGSAKAVDQLSPSEKYDLLIGDASGSLTTAMWNEGKWYFDRNGAVETWMGICHGWAPASYMLSRPTREVILLAADGKTKLRFYPADIKALASLLWANANTVSRLIGGRCNDKNPACDENGRVISSKVFDTNPGTWHLCVVNQIGVNKRSFVMDATYDYEVWNQPICRYEYKYFNPQTLKVAKDLKSAKVTKARFTKDRFRKYRSASAASFVGVMMEVSYVAEHEPTTRATDGAANDNINTVLYKYDLELDANGRIIGGEWYTGKAHPDFLWTPPPGTRAISEAEQFATGDWSADTALPEAWRRAARRAAGSNLPLAKIVEALIRFSNR
ncbi:MAG: hypothetical protein U1A78_35565 [Polyangia bacterium]